MAEPFHTSRRPHRRRTVGEIAVRAIELLVAAGLAAMLVLTFTNCVLRYAFDSGIAEAEEIAVLLLVWTTFLGAIAALARNEHLGIELLGGYSRRVQTLAAVATKLIMLGVSVIFVWGSWVQVGVNLVNALPVSGLSLSLLYAAGVVSGSAFIVVLLAQLARMVPRESRSALAMPLEGETAR